MTITTYLFIWCGILSVFIVILWELQAKHLRRAKALQAMIDIQHKYLEEKKVHDDMLIAEIARLTQQARIIIEKFNQVIT